MAHGIIRGIQFFSYLHGYVVVSIFQNNNYPENAK